MAIREKVWDCRDCDTKGILGRHKECPSCGSAREKGEMRSLRGVTAPTVTDPELLGLAKAGADWFCTHCSAGNRGDGDRCSECGAPRYATAEEDHPDFAGAHKKVEGADAKLEREMDQDPRPPEPPPPPRPPPPRPVFEDPPPAPHKSPFPAILVGIMGLFGAVTIAYAINWAFTTHEVVGSVASSAWSHTVHVERWTDTTVRKWRHQTTETTEVQPTSGSGERAGIELVTGSCRDEHFDDEKYVCGSHQDCHDVYRTESESYSCSKSESYECGEDCRDLGNGFEDCSPRYCTRSVPDTCTRDKQVFDHEECRTVDDYCTRPIMKPKCNYNTQEWVGIGDHPTSGAGIGFQWATFDLGTLDRARYSATYRVTSSYTDDGPQSHVLVDTQVSRSSRASAEGASAEYLSWKVSDPVYFQINNLGGVSSAGHTPPVR